MSAAGEPGKNKKKAKNKNKKLSRLQSLVKPPFQNQANGKSGESQEETTLECNRRNFSGATSKGNWRVGNNSAKKNKKARPSDRNWRTTKASSDHKNPLASKNQPHKKQEVDSFTVTGLLCQVSCKGSDECFYVKVLDEPLTGKRLKCYFRILSDSSVPLIQCKTKFLLCVKFICDYDQQPPTKQKIRVLWVNPLEYIKLTSSDVLEVFKKFPLPMTHEEIILKFYFPWRPFFKALLSQAHQFNEEALTKILYYIAPHGCGWFGVEVVQSQEHHCRFKEIIKLFTSRESNFLLKLNQFDFRGKEELVKELIELVATTNNCLDPVCHLLRRYYDNDIEELLNLIEKCCKGFDTSLHSLAAQNFQELPLIPVMEELKGVISAKVFGVSLNPAVQNLLQLESHLLPNRTDDPWESPEEFLNVHFRLLREECFASIRDRIARVRSDPSNDQLVHRNVKVVSYAIDDGTIVVKIKFKPSKIRANLMFGNLLCLDVDTDFSNPIWATVKSADRGSEISISLVRVGNDYISGNYIDTLNSSPSARVVISALQRLIATQSSVMVESPTYYHAFRPVLARLQTLTPSDFPFASEILVQSKEPQPSPIKFVRTDNFPRLDGSQRVAAEAALKNRFSLIQGPPGCGKTFVGNEIVRTMLNAVYIEEEEEKEEKEEKEEEEQGQGQDEDEGEEEEDEDEDEFKNIFELFGNLKLKSKSSDKEHKGPILVISYKNHALDSFLENCLKFRKDNSDPLSLTRIGGRSTSEAIKKFDLHNQIEERKDYFLKRELRKLKVARKQLRNFAEKVENTAAKSLISFTPSALIDSLLREQGANGEQQLYSLMARNFTKNYRKIIGQKNYECDSPEEAVADILSDHPETAKKILKMTLDQWLPEKESEKYLPKPRTSLFINKPKSIKDEDDDAEDDEEIEEEEWEKVVAERFVGSESKLKFIGISRNEVRTYQMLQKRLENLEPDEREQTVCRVGDVWSLSHEGRYVLLSYWLREWRKQVDENLAEALDEYSNFYRQVQILEQERNVEFLKSRDLIACTITGCCLRMGILDRVAPSIVIVEEAAEILESQLIAALPSSVKHVVLVGDHQQLPPQVNHYRLKTKFNLGISIFERLANNGYPVSQLRFHRRGPQSLCPLFARFYKQKIVPIKEDPSPPPILAHMGLFYWWTHEAPAQRSPDGTSFENEFEGAMLVGAVHLLIRMGGIDASKITIITGYFGQTKKIKQMLEKDEIPCVKVYTIDRYQGDENDFIFLSLTRSISERTNCKPPSLGFLASPNRTCVALSRARMGLYVFGCSSLFQQNSTWSGIVEYFRQRNKIRRELPFNHSGKLFPFKNPNDFSLFFEKLQLQEQEMKLKLYNQLSKKLPKVKPGIHDVTAKFGWKMENLMNNTILDKRDLGLGWYSDKKKYSRFKVTKVRRIYNEDMYLTYLHHVKKIEDKKPPPLGFEVDTMADWMVLDLKLNKSANEVFLFHGTKRDKVDIIAKGGFDERVARKGDYFGTGIYFAENAEESDRYTDDSEERFMFLARVTLGNTKEIFDRNYDLRRPPPIDLEKPAILHDSVIAVSTIKSGVAAAVHRHQEFIIFDRYQCLPEFIIHYCRQ